MRFRTLALNVFFTKLLLLSMVRVAKLLLLLLRTDNWTRLDFKARRRLKVKFKKKLKNVFLSFVLRDCLYAKYHDDDDDDILKLNNLPTLQVVKIKNSVKYLFIF